MIMEKAMLNNQIVQCRAAVRKARVCIIRKKIKKLKILKSCKKEKEMDKKLKKSERLLEEILLLKKVKEDDVTKFALQQNNLKEVLQKTPLNDHEHVYATLAVYPDVQKQLAQVRNTFPDPEGLLKLLQSLGTKSAQKKNKKMREDPSTKPSKIVREEINESDDDKVYGTISVNPPKIKIKAPQKLDNELSNSEALVTKPVKRHDIIVNVVEREPEQKVVDPFFVSKKVAIPKLILDEVKENPKREIKFSKPDTGFTKRTHQQFNRNNPIPNRRRYDERDSFQTKPVDPPAAPVEEKLHPSWAAKKIKLIQPFQGTKIKFDD